ncbi:glycosyltransferase family 4 protein [Pseudoalteromonas sp. PA2MD11]|uniref:glycosyltransferase family 4 protein n=1 Tax=Pseudoalteromonas sp. PA2MD11 TaxID=2785057 RepID=UPI001ADFC8C0|nr:glycosyltransferase family 4 protein [Pseudoalteromonas sp. PA2MD11]
MSSSKLLYFSTTKFDGKSANEVHVIKMCNALNKFCDIKLFGIYQGKESSEITNEHGVDNINISLFKYSSNLFYYFWCFFQLLMSAGVVYSRSVIIGFFSTILNKKTIVELHYLPLKESYSHKILSFLARNKKIAFVCITDALKVDFVEYYTPKSKNVYVMPDAADFPSTREKYIKSDRLIVGYVGSFNKGKGVDLILKVAKDLSGVDFHLVGGSDDQIRELKEQFGSLENVVFHGRKRSKDVSGYINSFDVCLLPNSKKVFTHGDHSQTLDIGKYTSPLKLFEYMAHKKVILCSKLSVLEEVISNSSVYFFDSDSASSMKENLLIALNDKSSSEVANNSYNLFKENYTWEKRAGKILRLVKNV